MAQHCAMLVREKSSQRPTVEKLTRWGEFIGVVLCVVLQPILREVLLVELKETFERQTDRTGESWKSTLKMPFSTDA